MSQVMKSRRKHQASAAMGGGGGGLPDYGDPSVGLTYDSLLSSAAVNANNFGATGNLNSLTDPASTNLYTGALSNTLFQYLLTDQSDVSSGTTAASTFGPGVNNTDIDIQADGLAIVGNNNVNGFLKKSILSSAFDLTSDAAWANIINLGTLFGVTGTGITGVYVNPDGTKLWCSDQTLIHCATMATPWDYANAVKVVGTIAHGETTNYAMTMTPDEKYIVITQGGGDNIRMIELTVPGDITGGFTALGAFDCGTLTGGLITIASGVVFDVWRKQLFVLDRTDKRLYQFSWTG
jgi:hypothetical protein